MRTASEDMEKTALGFDSLKDIGGAVKNVSNIIGLGTLGIYAANKLVSKIQNDTRRKALIEDLSRNDPILKEVDKVTLLQWYATIYHIAPQMSLDRVAVREILQQFARFGRVDLQTLKMMAETEAAIAEGSKGSKVKDWIL